MSTGIYGRTALEASSQNKRWKYTHEFEHRGHGIVAIYSYGPAGEHDKLVAESKRVMRERFGVSDAVSSGGVSGYPQNRPTPDPDWQTAICETQTIFCIHAVGGPNRPKPKQVSPRTADWHVAYIVDIGQDYLGDGEMNLYFTGPLLDAEEWQELVDQMVCDGLSEAEQRSVNRATVLELKVSALQQGAYWFLADDGPVAEVAKFEVTP